MRKLDRYILKELTVPFFIGVVALVFLWQANLLIAIMKDFNATNIPPLAIAQMIFYKTPEFMKLTLPMGMALATSLALTRLTRESELIAMRSAGIPVRRVLFPVLLFGALVGVGNFYMTEKLQPIAEQKYRGVMQKALILGATPNFMSNVMLRVGPRGTVYFSTIERLPNGQAKVTDVIYIENQGNNRLWVITGREGFYEKGVWVLPNGITRSFQDDRLIDMKAGESKLDERITLDSVFAAGPMSTELPLEELLKQVKRGKEVGLNTRMIEVEVHRRFAVPAVCFIFALTGPVLAVLYGRGGAFVGVLLSAFVVVAYYNVYVIAAEIFGRNGWLPPFVAAWFPNFLFLALGLWLLRKVE